MDIFIRRLNSIDTIKEEISKAENFEPKIDIYYIATTAPPDVKLQKEVRLLSKSRVGEKKFPVKVLFWQDLIPELLLNKAEFKKHYPQLSLEDGNTRSGARLLSLLDIAYYGLYLKDYMYLVFGEFGRMVNEDPLQIEKISLIIESCAINLLEMDKAQKLTAIIKEFRDYTIPYGLGKEERQEGWKPAQDLATSIESRIDVIQYGLTEKELIAFQLGRMLGNWNQKETNNIKLSEDKERAILLMIEELSPQKVIPDEILKIVSDYRQSDSISTIHTPHEIYSIARRIVIRQEITKTE